MLPSKKYTVELRPGAVYDMSGTPNEYFSFSFSFTTAEAVFPSPVIFKPGSDSAQSGSSTVTFYPPCYLKNGHVMVPVWGLADALQASASWSPYTNIIPFTGTDRETVVKMRIGSNIMFVNDTPQVIDTAPESKDGSFFVPGIHVGQAFGYHCYEDSSVLCMVYPDENGSLQPALLVLEPAALTLATGESRTLTLKVIPPEAEGSVLTWKSDNPQVTVVDSSGKVTGVSAGTATVTVSAGSGQASAACTVTVTTSASSGGGGGGGGGGGTAVASSTTVSETGKTVQSSGAVISIPAQAVSGEVRIGVSKVPDTSGMSPPEGARFAGEVYEITKDKPGSLAKPVTVTLPFRKDAVNPTEYDLVLCYWDGKQWIPLSNIRVDVDAGTVSGEVAHFTRFAVIAVPKRLNQSSQDKKEEPSTQKQGITVPEDVRGHWAEDSIVSLMKLGVVAGYPEGGFRPNRQVTRAEFVSIIARAFSIKPGEENTLLRFKDGKQIPAWCRGALAGAVEADIIRGYPDGTLAWNKEVSRAEVVTIIARAGSADLASPPPLACKDESSIPAWAKPSAAWAAAKGVLSGMPDNTLRLTSRATRAEVCALVHRILDQRR